MMKTCNDCNLEKALTEYYSCSQKKDGIMSRCKSCAKKRSKKWNQENNKLLNERRKKQINKDPEKNKKYHKDYYKKTHSKRREWAKAYYQKNKEKILEQNKRSISRRKDYVYNWHKKYREERLGYFSAKSRKYSLQKEQAMLRYLSKEQVKEIEWFYEEAAKLTKQTGIKHEVDHIVPLQGKDVSGLHVPWNLQVITAKENRKKSNKYEK